MEIAGLKGRQHWIEKACHHSSVEVRKLVTEYIIDDMLPLTTVESPTLKKLVDELLPHLYSYQRGKQFVHT